MPSHMSDDHARRCTAHNKKTGERCANWAAKGGNVCRFHGGNAPHVKAARQRRVEEAKLTAAAVTLGLPLEIDPAEALLQAVWEAAGNVAFYRELVQHLEHRWDEMNKARENGKRPLLEPDLFGVPAIHVVVGLYDQERDRLARYAKAAVDAGIAERRVQIAEQQGEQIANVFVLVLEDPRVKLTPAQQTSLRLVAAEKLRELPAS